MWKYFVLGFALVFLAICVFFYAYRGTVQIEAQIIYNMGGPQPVARQTFYLMSVDPDDLAVRGTTENGGKPFLAALSKLTNYAAIKETPKKDELLLIQRSIASSSEYLEPYASAKSETDFKGIASFNSIRPGKYWILGATETRGGIAYWSTPVEVSVMSTTKTMLDQSNAKFVW